MASSAPQSFPCSTCGGQMAFDAAAGALACPYCGSTAPVAADPGAATGPREIPIEEGLARAPRGLLAPVTTIGCEECGATVHVGEGERTARCAFCGSQKVLPRETDANVIRPESLLPFGIDRDRANERFGAWLKGLWFRPNDLQKLARLQEMGGVYVPFWTFDADVRSQWTADAGYHYYETEHYTETVNGQTVHRTRQVQRTRWEPAWGARSDRYDDLLVCASKGLPADLANGFSTFQTQALVPYQPQYLAGWRAESYAIDLVPAWQSGMERMAREQESRCARDVPGDTHRNLHVSNAYGSVTFKHVLLPVWIAAYRYDGKVYRFLVNGQTGEVVGKAPWSVWKIASLVVAILALVALVVALASAQKSRGAAPGPARATTPAVTHAAPPAKTPPKLASPPPIHSQK